MTRREDLGRMDVRNGFIRVKVIKCEGGEMSQTSNVASAPTLQLPDVNAETYPFEKVQYLLDEVANFNIFALPSAIHREKRTLTHRIIRRIFSDSTAATGWRFTTICTALMRMSALLKSKPDCASTKLSANRQGKLSGGWFFSPPDYKWNPDEMPPATIFDPWSEQSFVVYNNEFNFGDGNNFLVYGLGQTFPINVKGKPQLMSVRLAM